MSFYANPLSKTGWGRIQYDPMANTIILWPGGLSVVHIPLGLIVITVRFWSTTRLCDRSDSLHFIHGGSGRTHRKSWAIATPLHRRHPELWLLYIIMFLSEVTNCLAAVTDWMQSNRLQLNDNKTELMWCSVDCRQHRLPIVGSTTGTSSATSAYTVRE